MRLAGRTALVTGGGRGLGAGIARALAGEGAAVTVAARTIEQVEQVASELRREGHVAFAFRCDVTEPAEVRDLVRAADEAMGHVDILVNNAGAATSNPLRRVTLDEWRGMFDVNATGTFLCTQAVLEGMLERGFGRVVNVASVAGLEGGRYVAAYTAAKHAVVGFTRAVAAEVAGKGVSVNAVCPGYVDTPMTDRTLERIADRAGVDLQRALERLLHEAGQPRLIDVAEVAARVVELAAEPADDLRSPTNGAAVRLDGRDPHPRSDPAVPFDHLNPEALGAPKGWTNGMLGPAGGRMLFVAGQDAAEPEGTVGEGDFVEQFGRALDKALTVVREAGGGPEHVGRMTVFVTSLPTYRAARGELGPVWRERMGLHFPAMALIEVTGLVDPRAQVEIEVTAVLPEPAGGA